MNPQQFQLYDDARTCKLQMLIYFMKIKPYVCYYNLIDVAIVCNEHAPLNLMQDGT
jgi:hypothetical protein